MKEKFHYPKSISYNCESIEEMMSLISKHNCEKGSKIIKSDLQRLNRKGFVCKNCHQAWSTRDKN